jgi:hypothetical protein
VVGETAGAELIGAPVAIAWTDGLPVEGGEVLGVDVEGTLLVCGLQHCADHVARISA